MYKAIAVKFFGAHALLWSAVPCAFCLVISFLILNYGTMFSASNDVAGIAATGLTVLVLIRMQATAFFRELLIKDEYPGPAFTAKFREIIRNYEEYWAVKTDDANPESANPGNVKTNEDEKVKPENANPGNVKTNGDENANAEHENAKPKAKPFATDDDIELGKLS